MWQIKEFVPDALKDYLKLVQSKLRHPGCFVGSSLVSASARLGRECSIARNVQVGNEVEIGDYSYINVGAVVASGSIGRFCSIGPYAMIGLPEHPLHCLSTSPHLYARGILLGATSDWKEYGNPPHIGSDVWVGAFAVIRQGVRVEHGAVVGAGAVVTHDVGPYQIVAGVPARPIHPRFESDTVKELLAMRWWDRNPRGLTTLAGRFLRPEAEWPAEASEVIPR